MSKGIYRARVEKGLGKDVLAFLSSMREDLRILDDDIDGTEAHDIMLFEQGIISKDELKAILRSLEALRREAPKLAIPEGYEDLHEFIEAIVIEREGMEVGGRLHTARSRNDQVALDIRLRVRDELLTTSTKLIGLVEALLDLAEKRKGIMMPLYTHGQQAQIGLFSHYLLSLVDTLLRDLSRLEDSYRRVNRSPLGACAIGGTSYRIDRLRTASLLGFDGIVENSIDAVSSKDCELEVLSDLAMIMTNLSRISSDLILWSGSEFGFIELPDELTSTSSVMPQKKNPDALELIRARSGRALGSFMSLATVIKALPTGYNRDLQETKPPLWSSFDAANSSLDILHKVFRGLKVNEDRLREVVEDSFALALDLAEELARVHGLSFREAHRLVGEVVKQAVKEKKKFRGLTQDDLARASRKVLKRTLTVDDRLLRGVLDPRASIERRASLGGASIGEVDRMLRDRRRILEEEASKVKGVREGLERSMREFRGLVQGYLRS